MPGMGVIIGLEVGLEIFGFGLSRLADELVSPRADLIHGAAFREAQELDAFDHLRRLAVEGNGVPGQPLVCSLPLTINH